MIIGIGAIVAYGGTTPPTGSLLCDGSAISRATYSGLFAVIGIRFGAGDGATTFNLPNMPGAVTYVISYADDTTGNGAIVLAHAPSLGSPTLSNPILGTASATSLAFSGAAGLIGTATGGDAAAGSVGEYVVSRVRTQFAVDLTSETAANVTSISLTAGDWDVCGQIAFLFAETTTIGRIEASLTRTSGTRVDNYDDTQTVTRIDWQSFVPGQTSLAIPCITARMSISEATTVYLLALSNFTVSTVSACGFISARRMR
jgi:microcystin-dependent protein